MAKIDKKITKAINEGNFEDVPVSTSRDHKMGHAHKYPEQIRETVAAYETEVGYPEQEKAKNQKIINKMVRENKEAKIAKRKKARRLLKQFEHEQVLDEHAQAIEEMVQE